MKHLEENDVKIYRISAKSGAALAASCAAAARQLEADAGRRALFFAHPSEGPCRRAFAASEREEIIAALRADIPQQTAKRPKLIFAMPGQGSAGPVPAEYLCAALPVFREYVERAQRRLERHVRLSVKELLTRGKARSSMEEQLFVFIYGTALAMQYRAWGAEPDMIAAHSLGELSAMAVCEMTSYEEMLDFVCRRALIIDSLAESGAMAHVAGDFARVRRMTAAYGGKLSLAAVNSRESVVVSGDAKALSAFERELDRIPLAHKRLRVPKAAHSAVMEPALAPIAALAFPSVRDGRFPLYSSVSGGALTAPEAEAPAWRIRHCRETARFDLAIAALAKPLRGHEAVAVEFGVHRVLAAAGMKAIPGSKWYGASTMSRFHENRSQEYCFKRGIMETAAALYERNLLKQISAIFH